jgi:hypothetical protein
LEGVLLHPVEDSKGVWRFDPDEVEQLAADVRSGRSNLWDAMNGADPRLLPHEEPAGPCQRCIALEGHLAEMEASMSRLQRQQEAQLRSLQSERAAERACAQHEARQVEREATRLLAEVEDLLR